MNPARPGAEKLDSPLLQLDKATLRFGGLAAVSELDLSLGRNELVGLIGPNGAGKTSAFNLITGVYSPSGGSILFDGRPMANRKPHQIARAGIARTFQNIRLFASMTVFDNVRTAARLHCPRGVRNALWRGRSFRDGEKEISGQVMELLEIFQLGKFHAAAATSLSYGDQRRLEIVRALATKPKLLLLDEPAAGLTTAQGHALFELLTELAGDTSVLFIEHDMALVFGYARRVTVMAGGALLAQGMPDEIRANPVVRKAYLGH